MALKLDHVCYTSLVMLPILREMNWNVWNLNFKEPTVC
ncbi:unnamed protein product [Ixodes pacificus]